MAGCSHCIGLFLFLAMGAFSDVANKCELGIEPSAETVYIKYRQSGSVTCRLSCPERAEFGVLYWKDPNSNIIGSRFGRVFSESLGFHSVRLYLRNIGNDTIGNYTCRGSTRNQRFTKTVTILWKKYSGPEVDLPNVKNPDSTERPSK